LFVKPPKPSFEPNPERESWSRWHWDDVAASWNWKGSEGKPLEVNVYSSCDEVELFLNGKSFGRKPTNRSKKFMATFSVPYSVGTLQALGYSNKQQVNKAELVSAGSPQQLRVTTDRKIIKADNQDLAYVTIELLDAKGTRNPTAENLLNFNLTGPGQIIGLGNANPVSVESYQRPQRKAWQGRALVIVKAGREKGPITLHVRSAGFKAVSVTIMSE
jgi:beta-galactosidase